MSTQQTKNTRWSPKRREVSPTTEKARNVPVVNEPRGLTIRSKSLKTENSPPPSPKEADKESKKMTRQELIESYNKLQQELDQKQKERDQLLQEKERLESLMSQ